MKKIEKVEISYEEGDYKILTNPDYDVWILSQGCNGVFGPMNPMFLLKKKDMLSLIKVLQEVLDDNKNEE